MWCWICHCEIVAETPSIDLVIIIGIAPSAKSTFYIVIEYGGVVKVGSVYSKEALTDYVWGRLM